MLKLLCRDWHSPWVLTSFLWLALLIRVSYFYLSSDKLLISVIPDDAFYYLVLAQNRVEYGFWTFDGTAPASGFHLLYAYSLCAIYALFGKLDWLTLYLLVGIAASSVIAIACHLILRVIQEVIGKDAPLWGLAAFFSCYVLWQPTMLMESWLVILFAALTAYCVFTPTVKVQKERRYDLVTLFILGLIGFCGSLSRSDYGMFPGCIFIAIVLLRGHLNQQLVKSATILTGACLGVAMVLLHNYTIGGSFVQASAQIKLHNSLIHGFSISPSLDMIKGILFPFNGKIPKYIFFGSILLWSMYYGTIFTKKIFNRSQSGEEAATTDDIKITLMIACIGTLIGYVFLYRLNSHALQIWYVSNFIVPTSICLACIGNDLHKIFSMRLLIVIPILYVTIGLSKLFDNQWPHQASMMLAGQIIQSDGKEGNYAAWNAGIVNYFSRKPVTNLDGLTNDQIVPYIKSGKVLEYLVFRKINFLIDSTEMLTNQKLRIQGGYSNPIVDQCITPIRSLDYLDPKYSASTPVTLFFVDTNCLIKNLNKN
jgi:hypothetical protein